MDRNPAAKQTRSESEEQSSAQKRPYSPPAIEDETEFESLAMACGLTSKCGPSASSG